RATFWFGPMRVSSFMPLSKLVCRLAKIWRITFLGSTMSPGRRSCSRPHWPLRGCINSRLSSSAVSAIVARPRPLCGCIGGAAMGITHGLFRLGCCWALFSVMVAAAGTMSIAWMVVMTLVVFAEKVLPHGPSISIAVAVGLVALGLLVGSGTVQLGG